MSEAEQISTEEVAPEQVTGDEPVVEGASEQLQEQEAPMETVGGAEAEGAAPEVEGEAAAVETVEAPTAEADAPASAAEAEAPVPEAQPETHEHEQQPEQDVEAPPQEQAEDGADGAIGDDIEYEYDGHYFTHADVKDVVKIQAVYRRKANQQRIEEQRKIKADWEREKREKSARKFTRIEMPADDPVPADSVHGGTSRSSIDEGKGANKKSSPFSNIDYSKRLVIHTMSEDTKGMQRMYSRMLQTKDWW
jgi:hypothetical protein